MCGICGAIGLKKDKNTRVQQVTNMMKAIKHRGPDDAGILSYKDSTVCELDADTIFSGDNCGEGNIIMGFNRLSIIDTSLNGHQPMLTADRNIAITFNGEIYNTEELREELKTKGVFEYRSNTDTEVILYYYETFGFENMINRLNGMFAIAILDLRKNLFYLVRDRFGIKPVYYMKKDNVLFYASEMKALIQIEGFKPTINKAAVYEHFVLNNLYGKTMIEEIVPLMPGGYYC